PPVPRPTVGALRADATGVGVAQFLPRELVDGSEEELRCRGSGRRGRLRLVDGRRRGARPGRQFRCDDTRSADDLGGVELLVVPLAHVAHEAASSSGAAAAVTAAVPAGSWAAIEARTAAA